MSAPTTSRYLLEAILDPDSRNANFFNGRILTADALQTEQDANRRQRERLGQALGAGVITGFEVELVDPGAADRYPVVSVSQGLALNPNGQLLTLAADIPTLELTRQLTPAAPPTGLFTECKPAKTDAAPPTDRGVYLLVAAPASAYEELAPKVDFIDSGKANGCDSRYATEGVRFRLAELKLEQWSGLPPDLPDAIVDLMDKSEQASLTTVARRSALSLLRNLLAYLCFGPLAVDDFLADPLQPARRPPAVRPGLPDALPTAAGLSECETPLGLIYWTAAGVQFLDMWAVRRSLIPIPVSLRPFAPRADYPGVATAMMLQFQTQLAELLAQSELQSALSALWIGGLFRWLPPCGAIPMTGPGVPGGFTLEIFLQTLPGRGPFYVEGAGLESLYRQAVACPPIDLRSGEFFWLYQVRENGQARAAGGAIPPAGIVFASGHLPYRGDARFNQARWSFSHVASAPIF